MELKQKLLLGGAIIFTLAGSPILFGLTALHDIPAMHVIFPVGIIFWGLFFIVRLVEGESKVIPFDEQRPLDKAGMPLRKDEVPANKGAILAESSPRTSSPHP